MQCKLQRGLRIDPGLFIALVLPLFAISPLFRSGLPGLADALIHLLRTVELDFLWRHGIYFPRWAPNMAFGYGYPLFDFAPPLPYVIAEIFHLLGADFETAIKLLSILCFYLASLGMYLFSRQLLRPGPALLSAAAYIYTPFMFREQLIYGGNYPQILAISLYPWGLWAFQQLYRSGRWRYVALAALTLAAVILSHLFHIIAFGALVGAYLLFLFVTHRAHRSWRLAGLTVSALGLGVALSAYFLIPVAIDRQWTRAQADYYLTKSEVGQRFLRLSDLVAWPPLLDGSAANPWLPFSLSPPLLLLAATGLVGALILKRGNWGRRELPEQKPKSSRLSPGHLQVYFFMLFVGGVVFMMSSPSAFLWQSVSFLAVAEFPWRLMGLAILAVAFLAGAGWQTVEEIIRPHLGTWISRLDGLLFLPPFLATLVAIAPYLYPPAPFVEYDNPTPADGIRYELTGLVIGTTNLAEYLPRWAEQVPTTSPLVNEYLSQKPVEKLDRAGLPPGTNAVLQAHSPLSERYKITATVPFVAQFHTFFFPGWRAFLDGRRAEVRLIPPFGLIGVQIPAGDHELEVRFETLPHQAVSNVISGGALLLLVATFALDRRQRAGAECDRALTGNAAQAVIGRGPTGEDHGEGSVRGYGSQLSYGGALVISGSFIALFLLKTLLIDPHTTWFRQQSPPGQVLAAQHPARAGFGNQVDLIGYDLSATVLRPGDTLRVRLYWQARQAIDVPYSSFVHLDTFPPVETLVASDNFSPGDAQAQIDVATTSWGTSTYVRDEHTLLIPPQLPPRAYQLRAGLYDLNTGQRLPGPDDGVAFLKTINLLPAKQLGPSALPNPVDFRIEGGIHLLGYRLVDTSSNTVLCSMSANDCEVTVELFWRADISPPEDYTVFIQLVDEQGEIWGQGDGPPQSGAYLTSRWWPGQIIADRHPIVFDPALPPGRYQLLAGLYRPDTLERLTATGPDGPGPDGSITLKPLVIQLSR